MNAYLVWCPDDGETEDGAMPIIAFDPENAVTIWAEKGDYDSAEFSIAKGNSVNVLVRRADKSDEPMRYEVSGEFEPVYFVSRRGEE